MVIVARRPPPAEMRANHQRRVAGAIAAEERERERPRVANVGAVREIWSPRPLAFRGRLIPARPIQWEEGLDLMEAGLALERWTEGRRPEDPMTREELAELRGIYRSIMDLAWMALRPPWMPRWLRSRQRNPFRRATEPEILQIMDFVGRCRTISLVGHRSSMGSPAR